jgi:hypothetical protein
MEALFKDPPAKEDCPICFLPIPTKLVFCILLPPATISSVPINDFAIANKGVLEKGPELYYPCCGKSICKGCLYSFCGTGNTGKCPFCNSDRASTTEGELEIRRRVEANDPVAMWMLAIQYHKGIDGVQQDHTKGNGTLDQVRSWLK